MWLQRRGIPASLLGAVLRLQLLTRLVVCIGSCRALILNRVVGGLTGSLTALLCSRVPVESALLELRQDLAPLALDVGAFRLCAASYIDNLFTVGPGVSSSTSAMEFILANLADFWALKVKPHSKTVLHCRGCPDIQLVGSEWELQDVSVGLGWTLQGDAGVGGLRK